MAKIYVIMGKSSTGKDTIFREIMADSELGLKPIILYTTRPKRNGEENGKEYFFTNDKELEQHKASGKVVEVREYNTVHGIWSYYTLDDGQIDIESDNRYIAIATLEAYNQYVDYYGKENVMPIYIEVDNKTRIHRALDREDEQINPKYTEMCRRFVADEEDFSDGRLKEAGINKRYLNNELKDCIFEVKEDIMNM